MPTQCLSQGSSSAEQSRTILSPTWLTVLGLMHPWILLTHLAPGDTGYSNGYQVLLSMTTPHTLRVLKLGCSPASDLLVCMYTQGFSHPRCKIYHLFLNFKWLVIAHEPNDKISIQNLEGSIPAVLIYGRFCLIYCLPQRK